MKDGIAGEVAWAALRRWPPSIRNSVIRFRRDLWLMRVVEMVRPARMVETGVLLGRSSLALLAASQAWGGWLYSIDHPYLAPSVNRDGVMDPTHVLNVVTTGKFVPDKYRDRWTLLIGDSAEKLPPLLDSDKGRWVDLFFHDSEHSYEVMMREYRQVWPRLRPGGALVSDDIDWNSAFTDFAKEVGRPVYPSPNGKMGVLFR